ncbi:uncharacterized protein TRAVEDRAFT_75291 [Trametes versicolor FP-101664 SS1]|uniref:uncharacterized protein n=1 Tax=Trametes versicolor (strain FP-101664) TaxID=717944 RepID=UPI0004621ADC|nr:uncharacterized protein TRAVEDRAFT_75291 [Trametes versicolor FP-101664 SS1]EIW52235.1 hypothetical protein TRAVEDRAFT_75291 [Trametes versicolor FP-101664 SS1]
MASSSSLPLPLAVAVIEGAVTIRGSPKRPIPPPTAQPLSDKAQQRLMRMAVIQAELEAEEREALKITAEELQILQDSVKSVKAEFDDLDGLSWETPEAQQILDQWHAEQAARSRAHSLSHIGGVPMRRSNAQYIPSTSPHNLPSLSFSAAASMPDLTPMPSPVDESNEDTIRLSLCVDSRRSSSASTIMPDREDARTPLPSLYASLESKENDAPAPAEDVRPGLPKSYSAPVLTTFTDPFASADAPPRAHPARATKSLPPSRIPVRSKSFSARPSPSWHAIDGTPSTRHSSLLIRPVRGAPRAILAPSLTGNLRSPAKRSFADALSASPRRVHPQVHHPLPVPIPVPPRSPARTRFQLPQGEGSPRSKFRIISAPPMREGVPTFPSRNRAVSARVASGSGLQPVASGSGSPARTRAEHGSPVASGSSPHRGAVVGGQGRAGPGTPVRMTKRLRTGEVDGNEDEDGPSEPPSPSPSRRRGAMLGGVPMRRT